MEIKTVETRVAGPALVGLMLILALTLPGCGGTKMLKGSEPYVVTEALVTASDQHLTADLDWVIYRDDLRKAFDIQVAETLDEGRGLLVRRRFDAVILSSGRRHNAIRELEALAKLQNEEVTIVRLITGVENKSQEPEIKFLEKPFELASLSNALGVGNI